MRKLDNIFTDFSKKQLIPLSAFLNRIFPQGFYDSDLNSIVDDRSFKPRKDCEELSIILPLDWEFNTKIEDRNWRMQLQGWAMFHPIMNFFDDYQDKKKLVTYFFDVIKDWDREYGDSNELYVTSRMPSSYAWYDMSVGFRGLVLAFFINRIQYFKIDVSDDDIAVLHKLVLKHISNLSFEDAFSLNNHGLFQIQGLAALIKLTTLNDSDNLEDYVLSKMLKLILSQFTENGIHKEHSPHYHFYATDTAKAIIDTGWYQKEPKIEKIVNNANSMKKWLVDPIKRPICVGDSILEIQNEVVFPHNEGTEKLIIADYFKAGYTSVRSNWETPAEQASMLFMTGMYHSKSHKHRDCLSFDWFEQGSRIICDSGKYGYRSDKYRNYFLSAKAHNSVEIDGFDIIKIKPYKSALNKLEQLDGDIVKLSGQLDYPAIKHFRNLYFKAGEWLVIEDSLDFAKSRGFTQWLHFEKDFKVMSICDDTIKLINSSDIIITITTLNKNLKVKYFCGDSSEMQGFVSDRDYKYEDSVAIGFSGFSKKEKIVTLISVSNIDNMDALRFISKTIPDVINSQELLLKEKTHYALPILKKIKHFFVEDEKLKLLTGKSTITTIIDDIPMQFYSHRKKSNDLVIFLPGATNRSKGCCDLQRYSWSDDFSENFISIADPTINNDNNLSIGWFQYKVNNFGIDALEKLIRKIILALKIDGNRVKIIGSSAGGFTALKLKERFKTISVLAINPQLYLNRYSYKHYKEMLNYSYPGYSEESVEKDSIGNISVSNKLIENGPGYVIILQNTFDTKHIKNHLNVYLSTINDKDINEMHINKLILNESSKLNVIYYDDEELKHSPPSKETSIAYLDKIWS